MMLKRSTTESKPSATARLVRAGLASLAAVGAVAALATGCLDRPVVPAEPTTSNVFVDQIIQTSVDKIDLLFMVDNSVSMQDKQEILKAAVPVLVGRLVSPICVDAADNPTKETSVNGVCKNGSAEFTPIGDIHIGIVSSSLGSHGSTICDSQTNPDDKARMIGSMRGIPGWNNQGFLAWDSNGKHNTPPGETDTKNLNMAFQNMIASVGEHGCGYEASLESWYRFLIDPEPPAEVKLATVDGSSQTVRGSKRAVNADGSLGACTGCDDTLLAQRKAFLRPDSLVAIVMLSDENDCSIRDDGVGWFVGSSNRMPKSTKVCETNPNDPCCRSCAQKESTPPAGCGALSADPTCMTIPSGSPYAIWDAQHDSLNLRCYNQHQRFGFNLLYDTSRYVNALKSTTIALDSTGQVVLNPLYDATGSDKAQRDTSLVFLAGIVGVPWQDIADDASLKDATGLTYLTAKELVEKNRWTQLLGTPHPDNNAAPALPLDPFMIETTEERHGTNTIANVAISPKTSMNPKANPINGHEQNIPNFDDLQYACTFPLATPKPCMPGDQACDCSPDKSGKLDAVVTANSPLCQGANGAITATQTSAKAYPGARELQVLKDLGDNAIVASICPKVTVANGPPESDPNYGYNPAVGAIIARLKDALKGKCLPRAIQTDDQGQVLCKVIEAQQANCDCTLPGRAEADPTILDAVRKQLERSGQCNTPGKAACNSWCECEIKQETGDALTACQANQGAPAGYCYIDEKIRIPNGTPEGAPSSLLKNCKENEQHLLRFVDEPNVKTPAQGAVAFIACLGQSVHEVDAGN